MTIEDIHVTQARLPFVRQPWSAVLALVQGAHEKLSASLVAAPDVECPVGASWEKLMLRENKTVTRAGKQYVALYNSKAIVGTRAACGIIGGSSDQ